MTRIEPMKDPKWSLATISTLLMVLGSSTQNALAESLPTGPAVGDRNLSPFYRWDGKLPSQPGVMLRQEPMPAQPDITHASRVLRILYTSSDARWRSGILPVSGSLYLPQGRTPKGGWPLVAWAHGTLGVADSCAPSWTGYRPRDATYLDEWLNRGFAVVATDYQGLGGPGPHPYTIWEAEGRSVLDGVRAATSAYKGQIANVVIITGQSQGSGAALGATRLAPTYAPDVGLIAGIATGVISTFPDGPYHLKIGLGYTASSIITRMVGGDLKDGSPAPDDLVTDKGRLVLASVRTSCTAVFRRVESQEGVTIDNAFKSPAEVRGLLLPTRDMTPVKMPVPVFLGTGLADSTIPPQLQYGAAVALCSAGSHLIWHTYPGATHEGGVHAALLDEVAFVRAALRGKPEPSNCATIHEPGDPGKPGPGIPYND
jgi:hypothetical protein